MENIKIRPAVIADWEVLCEFEQGLIEFERQFNNTLSVGKISYYDIKELIADELTQLLVAEYEGQLIASGFVRIQNAKPYVKHKKFAYLGFMYTAPAFRGRGINKIVVDRLIEWARNKKVYELLLGVYGENEGAIKAYQKAGFNPFMVQMRLGL